MRRARVKEDKGKIQFRCRTCVVHLDTTRRHVDNTSVSRRSSLNPEVSRQSFSFLELKNC